MILDFGLSRSSDHLVGSRQEIRRHGQSDLLGSFQIDDQLELGRLLDRQFSGCGSFENLIDKNRGTSVEISIVR